MGPVVSPVPNQLRALRAVGTSSVMPTAPGADAMHQSLVIGSVMLVLLVATCPTRFPEGSAAAAEPPPSGTETLQALITTSELVVGQNRFAFGLSMHNRLLDKARVVVRVYDIRDEPARLKAETQARYHELEVVEQGNHVHVHPDGTRHVHSGATDVQGIYVAPVTFERPGRWGVEILAQQGDGLVEATRLSVDALAVSRTPMPGTPAPRSRNLIASEVSDLRKIDSSEPPDPRLHQTRIADAIAQRKPQVIVFATPKYCTSRVCGPVVDVVRMLIPAYSHRVVFIHEEIWQTGPPQTFSRTVEEWNLRSEPWIFVVDGQGMIRAKFEGLTTRRELEAALWQLLGLE
ncbi:MAG: hypothetical protein AUH81_12800 [Candidatus Rokubacteria bacterium 13_1_40CM_4_69_5]|nr:MAG: hypothetical protein AUH81_12800 [Candidatus Rokubacteria bacterium 13_1_40CM_4_69_5]